MRPAILHSYTRAAVLAVALTTLAAGEPSSEPRAPSGPVFGPISWTTSFAKEGGGDFNGALTALLPLRGSPADAYLLALRTGWLHHRAGRSIEAIANYQEASRLMPIAIEPRLGMLAPMIAAKQWADAERQARQILRSDPGCFWASYWLVESLFGSERGREANEVSRLLVERYPGDATVLEQAVRCRSAAGEPVSDEIASRLAILRLAQRR